MNVILASNLWRAKSSKKQEVTASLMKELRQQNTFESVSGEERRKAVLARVASLLNAFVRKVSTRLQMPDAEVDASGCKVFTFGSYRLGVHGPDTDIDVLCVVPKHVSRDAFFELFEIMLRNTESVTEVSRIREARVPLVKAKMSGVSLDILCASLTLSSIPEDLELTDNLLCGLDPRCVRSLGGPRVADDILRLVPNVQVFRDVLRCIRRWARRRAIYSYVSGFLGGVAWAILVAHVCQLYPKEATSTIVYHFFVTMHKWPWPDPVLLKSVENGPSHFRVWNAERYGDDKSHRMPVITPAYPAVCSTRTVTTSTQLIMTDEFERGAKIAERVMAGTALWSELFASHDFFRMYKYYLKIRLSARTSALLINFARELERRVHQLVIKLENTDPPILAHPLSNCFHRHSRLCVLSKTQTNAVASGVTDACTGVFCSTTFFVGLAMRSKEGGSMGPEESSISNRLKEFEKLVHNSDNYDKVAMRFDVQHIHTSTLPDYVH